MSPAGAIAAFVALLAWAIALFLVGVQIVNLNVNDILNNGVNFWNVFWLSLVGVAWFGTGKAVK